MKFASKNRLQKTGRLQQFRPVQTALSGGFVLMLSSGIHIGYAFFNWESVDVAWTRGASSKLIAFIAVTWFMGSIAGLILAPMALQLISKRTAYVSTNIYAVLAS